MDPIESPWNLDWLDRQQLKVAMNYNDPTAACFKNWRPVAEHVCVEHRIDPSELLTSTSFDVYFKGIIGAMVLQLHRNVMVAENTFQTQVVSYPENWLEHFKERWAPAWFLKRWPVKLKSVTITTTAKRVCPHLKVPEDAIHLQWLRGFHEQKAFNTFQP